MNIEALLAPVSAPSPCGDDLSFSTEFDRITDMRRGDDPTLDQGEWVTALKVADWPGVADASGQLLQTRTKDLRLAMWMTEAWAMVDGFAGLEKGLHLCLRLCEVYWDELHPRPDGSDFEERIGNIGWLLQRVVALARVLPVTQGRQAGAAYSLQDLASARLLQTALERQPDEAAQLSAGRVTADQFQRALKETPARTLQERLAAARRCADHLRAWQTVVDQHLGADGPSFVSAKEALAEAVHDIERLARESGALAVQDMASSPDRADDAAAARPDSQPLHSPADGPLRTRAQALQQLRDVAAFFRQTEPHSPVAYLAEKAVKWGEMPLHEWLRKVVKDQGAMAHLQELLGLDDALEGAERL